MRLRQDGLKRCYRCEKIRSLSDFSNERSRSDGLSPLCRTCIGEKRLERLAQDPEFEKRQSAAYRAANPEKCRTDARARYNPEKAALADKKYRAAHPERERERGKAYRAANPERARAQTAASKKKNPEKVRAYNKAWKQSPAGKASTAAYKAANREQINIRARVRHRERKISDPAYMEKLRASVDRYAEEHPDTVRAIRRNRKARVRGAKGRHSAEEVQEILRLQRGKCANPTCRAALKDDFHVDHITPIARGGGNDRRNLQLLCPPCNLEKHAKDPLAWAREKGLLI